MKKLKIILIVMFISFKGFSQYEEYLPYIEPYLSAPIESGFFHFITPNNIQAGQLYQWYKINAPDPDNDMILVKVHTDSVVGMTHYKYQQYYKGLRVEAAGCIEHYQSDGSLNMINAKVADKIDKSEEPRITRQEAIELAISFFSREDSIRFAWEDEGWEESIQMDFSDSSATWFPDVELMWAIDSVANVGLIIEGQRYTLTYKFDVVIVSPYTKAYSVYIDADSGAILKIRELIHYDGPADIYGYGTLNVDTQWMGGFTQAWILKANNGNRNIHTKRDNGNSHSSHGGWNQHTINFGNATSSNDNWIGQSTRTSPHYFASMAWDYFYEEFGRTGFNWNGIQCRIRTGWTDNNAFYYPATFKSNGDVKTLPYLAFGTRTVNGNSFSYGWEPSVVAHEYTHGVINFTANLTYEHQSGALNESFCDIFGTVVQAQKLDNGTTDWIFGNSIQFNNDMDIRRLDNPSIAGTHWSGQFDNNNNPIYNLGQPAFFEGVNYCINCPMNVDEGGVHINSGVQNRWFFLLANGGSGWNENDEWFSVDGIGLERAALIAYYNLTSVLLESSQYADARQGSIWQAVNFFGNCSIEHQSTINAWHAVGLGQPHNCTFTLDVIADELATVVVFPNPASDQVRIKLSQPTISDITILDASGRVVDKFKSGELLFTKDISHLSKGVYFIKFVFENHEIVEKIIVHK